MRGSLWGVKAYKLSAEFAHVVGSLLVPTYFLLWNILSKIPGTASILVFHSERILSISYSSSPLIRSAGGLEKFGPCSGVSL